MREDPVWSCLAQTRTVVCEAVAKKNAPARRIAPLLLAGLLAAGPLGCSDVPGDAPMGGGTDAGVAGDGPDSSGALDAAGAPDAPDAPNAPDAPDAPDASDDADLAARSPGDLYVFECGPSLTVHALSATSGFKQYSAHLPTVHNATCTDGRWTFRAADWNRDGFVDVIAILGADTGTDSTEIHVLDGASDFQSFLIQVGTPIEEAGTEGKFAFEVGDYNFDGTVDLYAIKKSDVSATEVHVLDGAANFQEFLLQTQTPLQPVGKGDAWSFTLGDYNADGIPDLMAVDRLPHDGDTFTDVLVLDGAQAFGQLLLQTRSALAAVDAGPEWAFSAGDLDEDGRADVFAVEKHPSGASTAAIHVLSGGSDYASFLAEGATGLQAPSDDSRVQFDLAPPKSSTPDFVAWAVSIAKNESIGYGHTWKLDKSTISCSGLVGLSLVYTGYTTSFADYDSMGWGYCPINSTWVSILVDELNCSSFALAPTPDYSILEPGDILYSSGHVGLYVGNG